MKLLGGSDRKESENKRATVEIPASNWNSSQVTEHNNEKLTLLCLSFKMASNVIPNLNKKKTTTNLASSFKRNDPDGLLSIRTFCYPHF